MAADRWTPEVRVALDPATRGVLRVLGGPGTGKTSLLVDAAAARIAAGVEAQSVLWLTGSGRIGTGARSALTTALLAARPAPAAGLPMVVREPLIRSVHSYAFAVLSRAAQRAGDPPPRLVTGAEQDAITRELLAGDGPDAWPKSLRVALSTDGFVNELRNLLARCAERGVDAAQLMRLGRRFDRPEWTAAGRFARQYEQVMLLRSAVGRAAPQATVPALGAAELVGAALDAFATDPELLDGERGRIRLLLVDDAQQLDPQAAELVRVLAAGVEASLIAGDPNQAVFGFRGGESAALLAGDAPALTLTTSRRCAAAVADAIAGIAGRLPGAGVARRLDNAGAGGSVTVRLAASRHVETTMIADTLRRARLIDGLPWSQMAVIVRSVPRASGLPRALAGAGIPVSLPAPAGALAEQPAVAALLAVLTATVDGLDGSRALTLLSGPIGRLDPMSLRQLQRLLRRFSDEPSGDPGASLVAVLRGESDRLPAGYARPLRRVRAVLDAAARCVAEGRDPHYTLWQIWHNSGLQQRWLRSSDRGGSAAAQAGRDLDAVTTLFDIAEQYVSRAGGVSLRGLLEHVTAMRLAVPKSEAVAGDETVSVLSAHGALGHEWDLVVIAGLQEGLWPNTVPRGGVLHTQQLLDVLDGVGAHASARALLLAEERRLLVAAMGRARQRLLVTAVDGEASGDAAEEVPSGFFVELSRLTAGAADVAADVVSPVTAPPLLSAAAVVGRLRTLVCAHPGTVDDAERAHAAAQLARLARAGVPGADPDGWYGSLSVSTEKPLWPAVDGHVVTLSPSSLQSLIDCPLRWLAERHGATDSRDLRSSIGSLLHALIAEPFGSQAELLTKLDRQWQRLPFDAQWYADNELARHRAMLAAFLQWRAESRAELTEVGVEMELDGVIDVGSRVRLRGRIDRVERDAAGRLVIVDVKTARTPVTKDAAQRHAQLAVYQLAVQAGLLPHGTEPGGARLIYPGKAGAAGPTEREQDPLTQAAGAQWRTVIAESAAAAAGPRFVARVNEGCRHCPIRPICPAHTEETGR